MKNRWALPTLYLKLSLNENILSLHRALDEIEVMIDVDCTVVTKARQKQLGRGLRLSQLGCTMLVYAP